MKGKFLCGQKWSTALRNVKLAFRNRPAASPHTIRGDGIVARASLTSSCFDFSQFCHVAQIMLHFAQPARFGVILALICLLQIALARIEIANSILNPVTGESFEITWMKAENPVPISLERGPLTDLSMVAFIAGAYHHCCHNTRNLFETGSF
jgi:hypothetical protein